MTLRILHHNDPDGFASAYIVYDYALGARIAESAQDICFHSMAYGMPIPAEIDYAKDSIVMVDFSLQPLSVMEAFAARIPEKQFVWIDHHKTSVDMEKESPGILATIPGVRRVNDDAGIPIAACELTWKFFRPDEDVPAGIELLGSWDTWRYVAQNNINAKYFITYCNSIDCFADSPEGQEFWSKVISSTNDPYGWLMDTVVREGEVISRILKIENRKRILGRGFAGKFAGYSAIMTNDRGSSLMFEDYKVPPSEVDLMVSFLYSKEGFWNVSLYSTQDHIDCGATAKRLGEAGPIPSGGGHKGAAGFQCDWPYIEKLMERN